MRLAILLTAGLLAAAGTAGQLGFRAAHSVRIAQAPLVIGTGAVLPWATLGVAYSQELTVSGGTPRHTWAVTSGALPQGLALNAEGLLSGVPVQSGAFTFTATVTGATGETASRVFSLVVALPETPAVAITGLPEVAGAAQQPQFGIQLSSAYPRQITGTVTMTFTPNAEVWSDDPAVQFSTGGRTLNFTVPAGQVTPSWASPPALQTGTVAGQIRLTLRYSSGGQDLTPTFVPVRSVTVLRAAPRIDSVELVAGTGGVEVRIAGYSTPREVTRATFVFTVTRTGGSQTIEVPVQVGEAFKTWYSGAASTQYGSAFRYDQPFTVQGSVSSIKSVTVSLASGSGVSDEATASLP